eukprot:scaffold90645_cov63-Phaeocystis_antarctica.AAC.3
MIAATHDTALKYPLKGYGCGRGVTGALIDTILHRSRIRAAESAAEASPRRNLRNNLGVGRLDLGARDGLVRAGLEDLAGHDVRVAVGRRAAVLEVAAAFGVGGAGDADGAATVGHAEGEGVHVGGLVLAGQATLVALTVLGDVLVVLGAQPLDGRHDVREAAGVAHLLGGEVGVHASAVPVARDRLGVEGDVDLEVLGDTLQDVARHPHVIAGGDADRRADLELPLARHDLGVGARDGDLREEARLVVRVGDGAAVGAVGAGGAVVRPLRAGVAALGPAERGDLVEIEQGVLLLETKPRASALLDIALRLSDEGLGGRRAGVGGQGRATRGVGVAQHQDVVAATEGVGVDSLRVDDHLGVIARGLAGRGAVVVPERQLGGVAGDLAGVEGAALGAAGEVTIDPDVLGHDLALLAESLVLGQDGGVHGDGLGHVDGGTGRAGRAHASGGREGNRSSGEREHLGRGLLRRGRQKGSDGEKLKSRAFSKLAAPESRVGSSMQRAGGKRNIGEIWGGRARGWGQYFSWGDATPSAHAASEWRASKFAPGAVRK